MSVLGIIRSALSPTVRVVRAGPGRGPVVSGLTTAALYRTQPNLRAVVGFLADNAASVPWKVYDRVGDGDRVRVRDSAAALLLASPRPGSTAYETRRAIFADMLLYDRHLSVVVRDASTDSGWSMWRIPPEWVDGFVGGTAWDPHAFVIRPPWAPGQEVPRDACLWIHGYDPADPAGNISPVDALRDILYEQVESAGFRRSMWERGGRFNAYITRPKDVEKWTEDAFERFRRTWDESWAGAAGAESGKMPILEDGMEIKQVQFSAQEAQWSEAKRLGREDVAGVFHVNPVLIWPGDGQTYASAKENARALYNDSLAPRLMEVTDAVNAQLLPMVGEPAGHYVEFDLAVKLQGSFEERAAVLQSAVGGPWMTRDEARAQFNLPHIEGADELIVPLNVVEGGLASPRDTDPTAARSGHAERKAAGEISFKAAPTDEDVEAVEALMRSYFERQARSVLPRIRAAKASGAMTKADGDEFPAWADVTRWDRELSDDLMRVAAGMSEDAARRALRGLGVPDDAYDPARALEYLRGMCEVRAAWVNDATWRQLMKSLQLEEAGADGLKATPEGVFQYAIETRAHSAATAFSAAINAQGGMDGVRQCATGRVYKVWTLGDVENHRESHLRVAGERVPVDSRFSNGATGPGDHAALGADGTCGCCCTLTFVREA